MPPVVADTVGAHAVGAHFSCDANAVVGAHTAVDHTDDAHSLCASPLYFHIASEDEDQYQAPVFPSIPPFPVLSDEACDTIVIADDAPLFEDALSDTLDEDATEPAALAESVFVDAPAFVDAPSDCTLDKDTMDSMIADAPSDVEDNQIVGAATAQLDAPKSTGSARKTIDDSRIVDAAPASWMLPIRWARPAKPEEARIPRLATGLDGISDPFRNPSWLMDILMRSCSDLAQRSLCLCLHPRVRMP